MAQLDDLNAQITTLQDNLTNLSTDQQLVIADLQRLNAGTEVDLTGPIQKLQAFNVQLAQMAKVLSTAEQATSPVTAPIGVTTPVASDPVATVNPVSDTPTATVDASAASTSSTAPTA